MKTADCDILIIPGLGNSGPGHWQTRWEQKLTTARRVEQADWEAPDRQEWVDRIVAEVAESTRPVILVAHSLGVMALVHAAPRLAEVAVPGVAAAFMVAAPDTERDDMPEVVARTFGAVPTDPLPFPSMLIASRNDPYSSYERADDFAAAWGSVLVDAGDAGHINSDSGHGPWPEGLTRFAALLSRV